MTAFEKQCMSLKTKPSLNCPFQLPEEIIEVIVHYMDIPSLSNVLQTCKQTSTSLFSTLLEDDTLIWATLVQNRFHIKNLNKKRPKTFGGATWKAAYRSLMCTNRIPKCRLLTGKGKIVFARPVNGGDSSSFENARGKDQLDSSILASSAPSRSIIERKTSAGVSLWVSIGHTDNCNVRSTRKRHWNALTEEEENKMYKHKLSASTSDISSTMYDANTRQYDSDIDSGRYWSSRNHRRRNEDNSYQKYIELHLCLQNTKSSNGAVLVDVSEAFVTMAGTDEQDYCNIKAKTWGKYKPKLLYYSGSAKETNREYSAIQKQYQFSHRLNFNIARRKISPYRKDYEVKKIKNKKEKNPYHLSLHPFEFAIFSVNIPCTADMKYETDFLSRSLLAHVPVTADCYVPSRVGKNDCPMKDENENEKIEKELKKVQWEKHEHKFLASASFRPEMEVWEHYMLLPGGCLVLCDSRHSMSP